MSWDTAAPSGGGGEWGNGATAAFEAPTNGGGFNAFGEAENHAGGAFDDGFGGGADAFGHSAGGGGGHSSGCFNCGEEG